MRGVRSLDPGAYDLRVLREATDIESFMTVDGQEVSDLDDQIHISDWARPVLTGGRSVLFLEEETHEQPHPRCWRVAAKEFIKRF